MCTACTHNVRFRQFLGVDLDESGAVDEHLGTHADVWQRHQLSPVLQTTVVLLQGLHAATPTQPRTHCGTTSEKSTGEELRVYFTMHPQMHIHKRTYTYHHHHHTPTTQKHNASSPI